MRKGWIALGVGVLLCGGVFAQGETAALDIDGDGEVDALTDGLLVLRYLFGFRGDPLTTGVVGDDCSRCDAEAIEARLEELAPPMPYATDPIVGNLWYVQAGTFVQGSPEDEPCRLDVETQFTHSLTRNLAVMETEVTRQMWADLRGLRPTLPEDPSGETGMNYPVEMVTWHEAVLFANLLSVERGLTPAYYVDAALTQPCAELPDVTDNPYVDWNADGYRLPTEGEWEYFTRAGTTGPFSLHEPEYGPATCGTFSCTPGTLPQLESAAWFCVNWEGQTQPAGLKAPNRWGLRDVHGNVWEWAWDWWGDYPVADQTNYLGPTSGSLRVFRGRGWTTFASSVRSAARSSVEPSGRYGRLGFRLVRTVE